MLFLFNNAPTGCSGTYAAVKACADAHGFYKQPDKTCANFADWNSIPITASYSAGGIDPGGTFGTGCCDLIFYTGTASKSIGSGCTTDCAATSATLNVTIAPCWSDSGNTEGRCAAAKCSATLSGPRGLVMNFVVDGPSNSLCGNSWTGTCGLAGQTTSSTCDLRTLLGCEKVRTDCTQNAGTCSGCGGLYNNCPNNDYPVTNAAVGATLTC